LPNGSVELVVIEIGVTLSVNCRTPKFAGFDVCAAFTRNV